jgi:hypothetical protein
MMNKVFGLVLLLASSVAFAGDPCSDRDTDERTAITSRLLEMYGQEQADAEAGNSDKAKNDSLRAREARKLDDKGWLCSPHDQFHAAWVMRFSTDEAELGRAYALV